MPLVNGWSMVRPEPKVRRARAGSGVCRLERQRRSGSAVVRGRIQRAFSVASVRLQAVRILALHRTGGVDIQRVQRMTRRHKQAVVPGSTETQVGAALGQVDVRYVAAVGAVDAHAVELVEVGAAAAAEAAPDMPSDVDLDAVVGAGAVGVDE